MEQKSNDKLNMFVRRLDKRHSFVAAHEAFCRSELKKKKRNLDGITVSSKDLRWRFLEVRNRMVQMPSFEESPLSR